MHEYPIIQEVFSSSMDKSILYTAQIFETHAECNCKGFIFSGNCRHLKTLRLILEKKQDVLF